MHSWNELFLFHRFRTLTMLEYVLNFLKDFMFTNAIDFFFTGFQGAHGKQMLLIFLTGFQGAHGEQRFVQTT